MPKPLHGCIADDDDDNDDWCLAVVEDFLTMVFIQTILAYKIYFLSHKEYIPSAMFRKKIAFHCESQTKEVNTLFIRV
jgi:hypothetical protein